MARTRPEDWFERLTQAAVESFILLGYRRCRMSDVASQMKVAPGTLYLYVKSKEALFDLALRYALAQGGRQLLPEPELLPLGDPDFDDTVHRLQTQIRYDQRTMGIYNVSLEHPPENGHKEFRALFGEVYDRLGRWRVGIKLLNRSALDHPRLAQLWVNESRKPLYRRVEAYLEARSTQGILRPQPQPRLGTRVLLETCASFAVEDPPRTDDDARAARETVLGLLTHAFLPPCEAATHPDETLNLSQHDDRAV